MRLVDGGGSAGGSRAPLGLLGWPVVWRGGVVRTPGALAGAERSGSLTFATPKLEVGVLRQKIATHERV